MFYFYDLPVMNLNLLYIYIPGSYRNPRWELEYSRAENKFRYIAVRENLLSEYWYEYSINLQVCLKYIIKKEQFRKKKWVYGFRSDKRLLALFKSTIK